MPPARIPAGQRRRTVHGTRVGRAASRLTGRVVVTSAGGGRAVNRHDLVRAALCGAARVCLRTRRGIACGSAARRRTAAALLTRLRFSTAANQRGGADQSGSTERERRGATEPRLRQLVRGHVTER